MTIQIKKPVNYLNNKDILKEIHESKSTYCSYAKPEYHAYDIIIDMPHEPLEKAFDFILTEEVIAQASETRATRMEVEQAKPKGSIDPNTIPITDLVFRVMTWDHIPLSHKQPRKITKKKSAKEIFEFEEPITFDDIDDSISKTDVDDMVHEKVNFPPFQHFIIDENNQFKCIGKSHWKNSIETGEFSKDHGQITNKLAKMYIMLCEKYAMKYNWRGYCVDEDTEALTKRGWLSYDQINENDEILSYDNNTLTWSSIESIYRGQYTGLMHHLTAVGLDSLITPFHKLVTNNGLKKVEHVLAHDKVILMGNPLQDSQDSTSDVLEYSTDFVELVGWILTEGSYDYYKNGTCKHISIYQNEGTKADRIRKILQNLNITASEYTRRNNNVCFKLCHEDSIKIFNTIPTKNLTMDFVVKLSHQQRLALLNTLIDGDGWRTGVNKQNLRYVQKNKDHIDVFQALCTMVGLRSNYHLRDHVSYGKPTYSYTVNVFSPIKNSTRFENINLNGGKQNGRKSIGKGKENFPNLPTTPYNGTVWCPKTQYGCFIARRNGTVFLTGNTYRDEMQNSAILQLTYVGLRFNEAKSQNPFAYYTAAITNSFCRVLNTEKKNQNIRDDILELNGLNPSWSRQHTSTTYSASDD